MILERQRYIRSEKFVGFPAMFRDDMRIELSLGRTEIFASIPLNYPVDIVISLSVLVRVSNIFDLSHRSFDFCLPNNRDAFFFVTSLAGYV